MGKEVCRAVLGRPDFELVAAVDPSYTGTTGNCVEAASADGVMVRDTKDRDGVKLRFTART